MNATVTKCPVCGEPLKDITFNKLMGVYISTCSQCGVSVEEVILNSSQTNDGTESFEGLCITSSDETYNADVTRHARRKDVVKIALSSDELYEGDAFLYQNICLEHNVTTEDLIKISRLAFNAAEKAYELYNQVSMEARYEQILYAELSAGGCNDESNR